MATASIDTVTKTVTEEIDERVIQLTLSEVEARALYALAGLIYSGDGNGTYRREMMSIRNAVGIQAGCAAWTDQYFYVDDDGDVRAKAHKPADK